MGYGRYTVAYNIDAILKAAARLELTQRELAERAGLSPVTVSRLAHGHRRARPETVRALARVVGLDAARLVKGVQPAGV